MIKEQYQHLKPQPDYLLERRLSEEGYLTVAGVDEVGRGPLAGPVVAAAVILDKNNNPIDVYFKESLSTNHLIEEFMLLANRTVAEEVSKIKVYDKPMPFPYRIHDQPDEAKLAPFIAFARKFGYTFDTTDADARAFGCYYRRRWAPTGHQPA